ncbi:uncharacterized protein LOC143225559 isoform X2 [Tachypleus tridentatus]|uniref:uncharacterized protein LOC143225559 isoform X2 n=1 Tax=Tachypleus tridentatus TaxID=6853 RepID=UPI003FD42A7E
MADIRIPLAPPPQRINCPPTGLRCSEYCFKSSADDSNKGDDNSPLTSGPSIELLPKPKKSPTTRLSPSSPLSSPSTNVVFKVEKYLSTQTSGQVKTKFGFSVNLDKSNSPGDLRQEVLMCFSSEASDSDDEDESIDNSMSVESSSDYPKPFDPLHERKFAHVKHLLKMGQVEGLDEPPPNFVPPSPPPFSSIRSKDKKNERRNRHSKIWSTHYLDTNSDSNCMEEHQCLVTFGSQPQSTRHLSKSNKITSSPEDMTNNSAISTLSSKCKHGRVPFLFGHFSDDERPFKVGHVRRCASDRSANRSKLVKKKVKEMRRNPDNQQYTTPLMKELEEVIIRKNLRLNVSRSDDEGKRFSKWHH